MVCKLHCVPKTAPPPPYVKYSNTDNTEQKSLQITENTLTSIRTLCAKLQVSSGSLYYYLLSATHQKMQFSKTKLSVLNPVNSLQSKNVHRQRSHTLAVEYATDNHVVLIKWKVHQCWRQSEQYWHQFFLFFLNPVLVFKVLRLSLKPG